MIFHLTVPKYGVGILVSMRPNKSNGLTIGVLAQEAGVGVETIRFYERQGLIKQPPRRAKGYRQYSSEDPRRIRFIRRAQELGFTLQEIGEFLNLNDTRRTTCADVKKRADAKLEEVRAKIRALQQMEGSLRELSEACDCGPRAAAECRILDCFESGCE